MGNQKILIIVLAACLVVALVVLFFSFKNAGDQKKKYNDCAKELTACKTNLSGEEKACQDQLTSCQKELETTKESLGGDIKECNDKLIAANKKLDEYLTKTLPANSANYAVYTSVRNLILEFAWLGNKGGPVSDPKPGGPLYTPEYAALQNELEKSASLNELVMNRSKIYSLFMACFDGYLEQVAAACIKAFVDSIKDSQSILKSIENWTEKYFNSLASRGSVREELINLTGPGVDMTKFIPAMGAIIKSFIYFVPDAQKKSVGDGLDQFLSNLTSLGSQVRFSTFLRNDIIQMLHDIIVAVPIPTWKIRNMDYPIGYIQHYLMYSKTFTYGPYVCANNANLYGSTKGELDAVSCVFRVWFCNSNVYGCSVQDY